MDQRAKVAESELTRVRSVIAALSLAGAVSLEAVAGRLQTSPRTLQRRLKGLGISFREVVEGARFEIAAALLRGTDLKVQEIAARLGYATPGTFARAFRRWAGCSPRAFRTATPPGIRMARNGQKHIAAPRINDANQDTPKEP